MFQHILVPVDGSTRSMTAVGFAAGIAAECDAELEVMQVVANDHDQVDAQTELDRELARVEPLPTQPKITITIGESVAATIAERVESVEGSVIVMSSTGRGRSAAVLGSVADELLNRMFGPIIVIGPNATTPKSLAGNIAVPVDGSKFSEASMSLAGAWGIGFGGTPWVIQVITGSVRSDIDTVESSYTARLAHDLHLLTKHEVDYEVLHGGSPAMAIVDFASTNDVRLIVMSTHGRTGLQRLTIGSVAAAVVHRAECPVVLHRPPRESG